MPENNSPEAKKAFIEDVKKKSLGGGRIDLYEVLADNILDSVKWAESNGAAFEPWLQQAPWNVGVRIASPGQYRGMPKLLKTLFDKYIEKGGKVLFKTKAKQLLELIRKALWTVLFAKRIKVFFKLALKLSSWEQAHIPPIEKC